ncbi:MAG TPA: hypothetical protein VLD67_00045, partial [Vicinamibacterales bacterium]|nr:hypothetical protein [Vicinamibacterales bacterium]
MAVPEAFARVMRVLQLYANVPASEVKALAQELDDIPGAGGASSTSEDFSIPVDYVNAQSIDPPAGRVLASSDDVAAALGTAPAFKHVEKVYNALPREIGHNVTINLAAGIHRPHSVPNVSFRSWTMDSKHVLPGATLAFQGVAPSLYTPRPGLTFPLAVTGSQLASGDPWMDFAGTPFTGLNLRGSFAVLNTGQTVTIHDHTNSRLFVLEALSPAPTSVTLIGRPGTVLRNSLTDTIRFKGSALHHDPLDPLGTIQWLDVMLDPFGANSNCWTGGGFTWLVRCILDQDSALDNIPLIVPDGNGWNFTSCFLQSTSFINRQVAGGADLLLVTQDFSNLQHCYMENSEDAIEVRGVGGLTVFNSVFNSVGRNTGPAAGSVRVISSVVLDLLDLPTLGKNIEFRNGKASVPSIVLKRGGHSRDSFQTAIFKGNAAACVSIQGGGHLDLSNSGSLGYKDGGGNLDVGIHIVGPGATANLNTGTNVTGAGGDVKIGGAAAIAYAAIPSTGT